MDKQKPQEWPTVEDFKNSEIIKWRELPLGMDFPCMSDKGEFPLIQFWPLSRAHIVLTQHRFQPLFTGFK